MKSRIEEEVDRISGLPDEILHHILSFLRFHDVVKVGLLSKRWKQVWNTFPNLECSVDFPDYANCKKIVKRLKQSLYNRCRESIGLSKLQLLVEIADIRVDFSLIDQCREFFSLLDHCLRYAIRCNVKELDFGSIIWQGSMPLPCRMYNLPQLVFFAKSIEVLKLNGCKLELPRSDVYLPSLKRFCLGKVYAEDQVIDNLVAGCPLIEYLRIRCCGGCESLELFGHGKLKFIELQLSADCTLKRVDINGLNVQSIDITTGPSREINIASCKNLKHLKLSGFSLMDDLLNNHVSQLLFLEYLCLCHCAKLRAIKISSPHLKELIIKYCWDLVEIKITTPNLSIFKYSGDIISFSSNALALSEAELGFYGMIFDTQLYVKFIEFLAKFNHFTHVLRIQSNYESVIIPKELRHILPPPLTGVKHLKFSINGRCEPLSVTKVVDGLLWISPHLNTILLRFANILKESSFQFSYKDQLNSEEEIPHCCRSLPVWCWQNCIKEVKIEQTTRVQGKIIDVKRYSSEDEEILGKIDGLYKYFNPCVRISRQC